MAILADRQIDAVELGYFLNEVSVKGKLVSVKTAGSGVAMDNVNNVATVAASSSGQLPLGMLINEFVSVDLTRFPINWHKDQSVSGDKATVMTKGWAVTDQVIGTPSAGHFAVLSSSGNVTNLAPGGAWNEVANPKVGRFRSTLDSNGFAKVYIDL
jgi:hypothetical protein